MGKAASNQQRDFRKEKAPLCLLRFFSHNLALAKLALFRACFEKSKTLSFLPISGHLLRQKSLTG